MDNKMWIRGLCFTFIALLCCGLQAFAEATSPTEKISATSPINKMALSANFIGVGALSGVQKIYIGSFGSDRGAEIIKEKIFNRLIKTGKLTPVETMPDADAILKGAASISSRTNIFTDSYGVGGGTIYSADLVVHLCGKDNITLWSYECKPSLFGPRSCSSNVADKMIRQLLKAIERDANTK